MSKMTEQQEVVMDIRRAIDQVGCPLATAERVARLAEAVLASGVVEDVLWATMALSMIAERYPAIYPRGRAALEAAFEALGEDMDDLREAKRNQESS